MSLEQTLVVHNPRQENPVPWWGWLLLLGGAGAVAYVAATQTAKAKQEPPPKLYGVYADCTLAGQRFGGTPQEIRQAQTLILEGLNDVGGSGTIDSQTGDFDVDLPLGDPPGPSVQENMDFVHAWATAVFKRGVHPDCLKQMGTSFGPITNKYGSDYSQWGGEWPGDTLAYFNDLITAFQLVLSQNGFDVGAAMPIASPLSTIAGGASR